MKLIIEFLLNKIFELEQTKITPQNRQEVKNVIEKEVNKNSSNFQYMMFNIYRSLSKFNFNNNNASKIDYDLQHYVKKLSEQNSTVQMMPTPNSNLIMNKSMNPMINNLIVKPGSNLISNNMNMNMAMPK